MQAEGEIIIKVVTARSYRSKRHVKGSYHEISQRNGSAYRKVWSIMAAREKWRMAWRAGGQHRDNGMAKACGKYL